MTKSIINERLEKAVRAIQNSLDREFMGDIFVENGYFSARQLKGVSYIPRYQEFRVLTVEYYGQDSKFSTEEREDLYDLEEIGSSDLYFLGDERLDDMIKEIERCQPSWQRKNKVELYMSAVQKFKSADGGFDKRGVEQLFNALKQELSVEEISVLLKNTLNVEEKGDLSHLIGKMDFCQPTTEVLLGELELLEKSWGNVSLYFARRSVADAPPFFMTNEYIEEEHLAVIQQLDYSSIRKVTDNHGGTEAMKLMLASGTSPKALAKMLGFELSKKEAHEWVKSGISCPKDFYVREVLEGQWEQLNSRLVMDWAGKKVRTEAMTKERVVFGPAGQSSSYTFLDIIQEIEEEDLTEGIKTSVEKAFSRAAERMTLRKREEMGENVTLPDCPLGDWDAPQIKQIKSSQGLRKEGEEMSHCVGSYFDACYDGRTYIYTLTAEPERVTLEIYKKEGEWVLGQAMGKSNSTPSSYAMALIEKAMAEKGVALQI